MTTMTASATTTTVIRVKRRRDEAAPPPTLRIDGTSLPPAAASPNNHGFGRQGSKRARRRHHEKEANTLAQLLDESAHLGSGGAKPAAPSSTTSSAVAPDEDVATPAAVRKEPSPTSAACSSALFRRVATEDSHGTATNKRKSLTIDTTANEQSSTVRVVEARLYSPSSGASADRAGGPGAENENDDNATSSRAGKRPRLALTVMGSRTVSGAEFWGRGEDKSDDKENGAGNKGKENDAAGAQATGDGGRSAARARMLRKAAAMTGGSATSTTAPSLLQKKKKATAIVYDPLTRTVDASLLSALQAGSVVPHLSFLRNNSTVQSAIPSKFRSLVNHAASDGSGTVLHLAALLDDLEGAEMALELGADPALKDGEGRTAEEAARLAGNAAVVRILGSEEEEEEDDFVYDVYYLETTAANGASPKKKDSEEEKKDNGGDFGDDTPNGAGGDEASSEALKTNGAKKAAPQAQSSDASNNVNNMADDGDNDDTRTSEQTAGEHAPPNQEQQQEAIELRNGVGYWNSAGELVLEAASPDLAMGGAVASGGGGSDNDMDDDEDSNAESYAGNDYPEDGAYGSSYHGYGGCDDDDSDDDQAQAYYNRYPGGGAEGGGGGGNELTHSPNAFGDNFGRPRVYCNPRANAWDSYNANHPSDVDADMSSDDDADYGINEFRNRPVNSASLGNVSRLATSGGSSTGRGGVLDEDSDGLEGEAGEYTGPMMGLAQGGKAGANGVSGLCDSGGARQFAYDEDLDES